MFHEIVRVGGVHYTVAHTERQRQTLFVSYKWFPRGCQWCSLQEILPWWRPLCPVWPAPLSPPPGTWRRKLLCQIVSSQYWYFSLRYLTSNTVADDQYEHAHVGEEDVGENLPDWLPLLHVELILFTHCLSYLWVCFSPQKCQEYFLFFIFTRTGSHIATCRVTMARA